MSRHTRIKLRKSRDKQLLKNRSTTPARPTGRRASAATRRRNAPDRGGLELARAWRDHPDTPPWARQHHPAAWAALLAAPAAAGWTARDLNQLISDYRGIGRYVPDAPYKPIGLLGSMIAWHGRENLDQRPATYDQARDTAHHAARRARIAAQAAQAEQHARDREQRRHTPPCAGRLAARAAAQEATRRAAARRTGEAAAEHHHLQNQIQQARTNPDSPR